MNSKTAKRLRSKIENWCHITGNKDFKRAYKIAKKMYTEGHKI